MQNNDQVIGPRTTAFLEELKERGFITTLHLVHDELHINLKRADGANHFNLTEYNEIHRRIIEVVRDDLDEASEAIRNSWRERNPGLSKFWGMCQGRRNDGK